ncbi:MAG TPA: hypothetical protein VIH89_13320 [Candidatus Sulfotelmatobacter sp.]
MTRSLSTLWKTNVIRSGATGMMSNLQMNEERKIQPSVRNFKPDDAPTPSSTTGNPKEKHTYFNIFVTTICYG